MVFVAVVVSVVVVVVVDGVVEVSGAVGGAVAVVDVFAFTCPYFAADAVVCLTLSRYLHYL